MPITAGEAVPHLSRDQRGVLEGLLQSRLAEFEVDSAIHLNGLTQAESAHEVLLRDPDDASQRAGAHEVEGIVADIDSQEFTEVRNALQRIHDADYGLCIDCHRAIAFERLSLEPQALRCMSCQRLLERKALL